MKITIKKQELAELYLIQRLTTKEIAEIKNCGITTINNYLKKYGIPRRNPGFQKGHKFSLSHRQKISESKKGANHPNFGKRCKNKKRHWYKCPNGQIVSMRSRWEVAFAHFLTEQGRKWNYEPDAFALSDGSSYTPDFYLIEENRYVEIKGWFTEANRKKISLFRECHSENLSVLQKKDLIDLGVDLEKEYPGSVRPRVKCVSCQKAFLRRGTSQKFCGNRCKNKWIANNRTNDLKKVNATPKRRYRGKQSGSHNNGSKLTETDVQDILNLRAYGKTLKEISKIKNISVGNVGNITKGRSWQHVPRK